MSYLLNEVIVGANVWIVYMSVLEYKWKRRERERERKKMKKMSFEVVACQYERTQSKTTLDDIKLPTKY